MRKDYGLPSTRHYHAAPARSVFIGKPLQLRTYVSFSMLDAALLGIAIGAVGILALVLL